MTEMGDSAAAIGALADGTRRALYRYVSRQRDPVSRDDAAASLDIPRHQAKFHLDRLEEAGLLTAEYHRLTGRSGPGAGRPAKVYRRAEAEVTLSLPQRQYEFAASLLADAIQDSIAEQTGVGHALRRRSQQAGRDLAAQVPAGDDLLRCAGDVLAAFGYEPRHEDERLVMANCPFHSLAEEHTDLVCGLNDELLGSFCSCVGGLDAQLDPQPGRCCVTISRVGRDPGSAGVLPAEDPLGT